MDLSSIDFEGLGNLGMTLMDLLNRLDIRTINTEIIPQLLTTFHPIWNPIMAAINDILARVGFVTSPLL